MFQNPSKVIRAWILDLMSTSKWVFGLNHLVLDWIGSWSAWVLYVIWVEVVIRICIQSGLGCDQILKKIVL